MNTNTKQKLHSEIIEDLKKFNWQFIIDYGNSLGQLNDKQLRFLKGFVCEQLVASEDSTLELIRDDHRDFIWHKHNVSVELKSQFSMTMYSKKGDLRKTYTIKFTNSNGTNNKNKLSVNEIADYTLVLRSDGSFLLDKNTVIKNLIKTGDGFDLKINKHQLIELSGSINQQVKYYIDLENELLTSIRSSIDKGKACLKK
jgi:hypothetical protein